MDKNEFEILFARQREEMRLVIREEIELHIAPLRISIGQINDEGNGGTGLAGEVARTRSRVNQLFRLRDIGAGVFLAISLTGAVLIAGLKSWVQGMLNH